MFANQPVVAMLLIGSLAISANASFQTKRTANHERSRIELAGGAVAPRSFSSYSSDSSSYSSQTQVSSFISSWHSLSESFSQCQSAFSQQSSIEVATQYVQQLYARYQAATSQYESCSVCSSYLSQSGYNSQIQQSVVEMYSSFQYIIRAAQQTYGEQFQSQFASTFQSMSSFATFSQQVCSAAGVDLQRSLSNVGINPDIFSSAGINLANVLNIGAVVGIGGAAGGAVDGLLGTVGGILGGGRSSGGGEHGHALLGGLLG